MIERTKARIVRPRLLDSAFRLCSDRSLTKKAYLNSVAAGLDYGARFMVRFFVTPILLTGLGEMLLGVWNVVQQMTEYVSASGRSSQALKWYVVERQSSTDDHEKRLGVGGAVTVWAMLVPLQVFVGAVVAWYTPSWLELPAEYYWGVRLATMIMVTGVIARGFTDVPRSVLEGENLAYKRMWLSATLVVVGGVLAVSAIRLEWGIVGVAAASLVTVLLTGLTFLLVVRYHVPWFGIARPNARVTKRFFGLSGWFIVWFLITRALDASDIILLGVLISPQVAAAYSLVRYLPEGTLRFITVLVYETVPGLGKILSSGQRQRAAKVRGDIMQLTWLATTVVGGTILLWNDSFLGLWVGTQYTGSQMMTLLLVLLMVQSTWARIDGDFINLKLDAIGGKVLLGAASVGLSILLAVVGVKWLDWGVNGMLAGFMLGRLVLTLAYPAIIGRVLNVSFSSQLAATIRPLLASVVIFGLVMWLSLQVAVYSWMGLAMAAPVTAMLIGVAAFFSGLTSESRRQVLSRVAAAMQEGPD